jgi:carboxypeptidase Taq
MEARKTNNFTMYAPILTKWINLHKQIAKLIDPTRDVYDVLLDDYEPQGTAESIGKIFAQLKQELVTFKFHS